MFYACRVYATSDSNWYNANGPGILVIDLDKHLDFLKACAQRGIMEAEAKGKEAHHLFPGALPPRPNKLTFFFDDKARWFRYDDRCEKFYDFDGDVLLEKLPSYMENGEIEILEANKADIEIDLANPKSFIRISCPLVISENELVEIYTLSQEVDAIEQLPVFDWKKIEDAEVLADLEEPSSIPEKRKERRRTVSPGA